MQNLTPYLMFNSNCEEALNFYKDCLGGEIVYLGKYRGSPIEVDEKDKDKVMHATYTFWGGSIMASDHVSGADYTTKASESNIHLSLGFSKLDEMKKTFNKMSDEGNVTMEIQDTFWGSTFGMFIDKFGVNWMFSYANK